MKGLALHTCGFLEEVRLLEETLREKAKESGRVKENTRARAKERKKGWARKMKWALAKGKAKAVDCLAWFASKRLL
jgi:hypothetical protein